MEAGVVAVILANAGALVGNVYWMRRVDKKLDDAETRLDAHDREMSRLVAQHEMNHGG